MPTEGHSLPPPDHDGFVPPTWLTAEGQPVSCREKIKVLNENLEEIRQMCQDALEDGILMECDEVQLRATLHQLVDLLNNPYAGRKTG